MLNLVLGDILVLVDIIYPITEDINFNINIKEQIYGGIDINDSSLGLNYQLWNISYIDNDIIITSTLIINNILFILLKMLLIFLLLLIKI